MVKTAKFVGPDVHTDTIAMAVLDGGALDAKREPVILPHDVPKLVKRLLALALRMKPGRRASVCGAQ